MTKSCVLILNLKYSNTEAYTSVMFKTVHSLHDETHRQLDNYSIHVEFHSCHGLTSVCLCLWSIVWCSSLPWLPSSTLTHMSWWRVQLPAGALSLGQLSLQSLRG